MNFICHSGGCPGADMEWENQGNKRGVHTIAYSFWNHKQEGRNPKILSEDELKEGFEAVMRANKVLKRYPQGQPKYIQNLLSRNWFQVKNSEAVFAIASGLLTEDTVKGGTGWAVQMAVDCDKPVFVYLQESNPMSPGKWLRYMPVVGLEWMQGEIPVLTKNFAGIGTREINQDGIKAIQQVYENTCMVDLNIVEDIVYIEGLPAFPIKNSDVEDSEKDWMAPDTATMYQHNKKFVDAWLKKQKI